MPVTKDGLVEPCVKGQLSQPGRWVMHLGNVEERFKSAWGDTFPGL